MNNMYGFDVIIVQPRAMYVYPIRYKKHRKKRRRQRVKTFSYWYRAIPEGETIIDENNRRLFMSQSTYDELQKHLAQPDLSPWGKGFMGDTI